MDVALRRVKDVQRELYSDYQHCHQPGVGIVTHPMAFLRWYDLLGKVIETLDAAVAQNTVPQSDESGG